MLDQILSLIIRVTSQGDGAQVTAKQLDDLKTKAADLVGSAKEIASAFDIHIPSTPQEAISAITGFLKESIAAANESAAAQVKLENALQRTGQASGDAQTKIEALATEQQRLTNISDETWSNAAAKLIQFGARAEEIPQLFPILEGLAGRMGGDVMAASEVMGRALNGNARGLAQFGVKVEEGASRLEILNALTKAAATGQGELQRQAQTSEGRMKALSIAWGDLHEEVGKNIANSPALISLLDGMGNVVVNLTGHVDDLILVWKAFTPVIGLVMGALSAARDVIDTTRGAVILLGQELEPLRLKAETTMLGITAVLKAMRKEIAPVGGEWSANFSAARQAVDALDLGVKASLTSMRDLGHNASNAGDSAKTAAPKFEGAGFAAAGASPKITDAAKAAKQAAEQLKEAAAQADRYRSALDDLARSQQKLNEANIDQAVARGEMTENEGVIAKAKGQGRTEREIINRKRAALDEAQRNDISARDELRKLRELEEGMAEELDPGADRDLHENNAKTMRGEEDALSAEIKRRRVERGTLDAEEEASQVQESTTVEKVSDEEAQKFFDEVIDEVLSKKKRKPGDRIDARAKRSSRDQLGDGKNNLDALKGPGSSALQGLKDRLKPKGADTPDEGDVIGGDVADHSIDTGDVIGGGDGGNDAMSQAAQAAQAAAQAATEAGQAITEAGNEIKAAMEAAQQAAEASKQVATSTLAKMQEFASDMQTLKSQIESVRSFTS